MAKLLAWLSSSFTGKVDKPQNVRARGCGCLQGSTLKKIFTVSQLRAEEVDGEVWWKKGARAAGMTTTLRGLLSKADSRAWEQPEVLELTGVVLLGLIH